MSIYCTFSLSTTIFGKPPGATCRSVKSTASQVEKAPMKSIFSLSVGLTNVWLSYECVRLGDEGLLGVSIALCIRAVPIRAELAAASARLGPERAAETLFGGSETARIVLGG